MSKLQYEFYGYLRYFPSGDVVREATEEELTLNLKNFIKDRTAGSFKLNNKRYYVNGESWNAYNRIHDDLRREASLEKQRRRDKNIDR